MALVLDAGGLIAVDRRRREIGAVLRVAQQNGIPVRTAATVVAQAFRDGARQPNLARVLAGIDVAALDRIGGRQVGRLLGRAGTSDVVDGHLCFLVMSGDTVVTSDPDDIGRLLAARNVRAIIRRA